MNLDFEEIKTITFGAVSIKSEMGGLAFYKCSDRQLEGIQTRHFGQRDKFNGLPYGLSYKFENFFGRYRFRQ